MIKEYLDQLKALNLVNVDNPFLEKGYDIEFEEMPEKGPKIRKIKDITLEFEKEFKIFFKFKDIILVPEFL